MANAQSNPFRIITDGLGITKSSKKKPSTAAIAAQASASPDPNTLLPGSDLTAQGATAKAGSAALQAIDQQKLNNANMQKVASQARGKMEDRYATGAQQYQAQAQQSLAAAQAQAGSLGGSVIGAMRDVGQSTGRGVADYQAAAGAALADYDIQAQQAQAQGDLDALQQTIQSYEYLTGLGSPAEQARQKFLSQYQPALEKSLRDSSGLGGIFGATIDQTKQSMAAMEPDPAVRAMIMNYGG